MITKRNTLKKLAGFGAVATLAPSSWTKPIIGTIVLPAHAQTSVTQALKISTSGPITGGQDTNDITADKTPGDSVDVELSINEPFSLSKESLSFKPLEDGQSETQTVDILNSDRSVSNTESVKVTWTESKLKVTTSGPVLDGENSQDISANSASGDPVIAELRVNTPFTLSKSRLSFSAMKAGQSETQTVDILNADGSINSRESVKVTWAESMLDITTSGPVLEGENSKEISADASTGDAVIADLRVNAPFTLSKSRLSFSAMKAGQSETQTVDILNANGSISSKESVKVTWAEATLAVTTSGPVVSGKDSLDITGDSLGRAPVVAKLSVKAPFSVSPRSLSFSPLKAGQSETQTVDILGPSGKVSSTKSVKVSWASSELGITTSGPVTAGADTDKITANSNVRENVVARLSVAAPFQLSKASLTFAPMKAGAVDTQVVEILNEDRSVAASKSISVSWAAAKK